MVAVCCGFGSFGYPYMCGVVGRMCGCVYVCWIFWVAQNASFVSFCVCCVFVCGGVRVSECVCVVVCVCLWTVYILIFLCAHAGSYGIQSSGVEAVSKLELSEPVLKPSQFKRRPSNSRRCPKYLFVSKWCTSSVQSICLCLSGFQAIGVQAESKP